MKIILDVIENTGITATAGIGTNLYLCKVAMDILAKHIPADENGVRIAGPSCGVNLLLINAVLCAIKSLTGIT